MKNIYKIFIALTLILTFSACENEENLLFLDAPETEFVILTPDSGTSIVLNKTTENNTATTVSWHAVDYGTPTVVNYTVQLGKANTDFLVPIDVATTTKTFASISVAQLNEKALELGLVVDKATAIEVRVKASVGTTGSQAKYSSIISVFVTPYTVAEPIVDLYLVGPATVAGWDANNNNLPMFRDLTNPKKYSYTGYFKADEFKLLTALGDWSHAYGTDGTNLVIGDGSVGNFKVPTAGYYTFSINAGDMTYSLVPYTGATTSYTTMDVNGTSFAGGWGQTHPMTRTAGEWHIWKLSIDVLDGVFLFSGDNWTNKWGEDGTTNNIPTKAGKYNIYFNNLDGKYIFINQ